MDNSSINRKTLITCIYCNSNIKNIINCDNCGDQAPCWFHEKPSLVDENLSNDGLFYCHECKCESCNELHDDIYCGGNFFGTHKICNNCENVNQCRKCGRSCCGSVNCYISDAEYCHDCFVFLNQHW